MSVTHESDARFLFFNCLADQFPGEYLLYMRNFLNLQMCSTNIQHKLSLMEKLTTEHMNTDVLLWFMLLNRDEISRKIRRIFGSSLRGDVSRVSAKSL